MTKIIEKEYNRKYKGYEITAKIHHERRKVTYSIYVTKNGAYRFTFVDESIYENFEDKGYLCLVAEELEECKKIIDIILMFKSLEMHLEYDIIVKMFEQHETRIKYDNDQFYHTEAKKRRKIIW